MQMVTPYMNRMKQIDLAYMAGIMDGEGLICIVPIRRKDCADNVPAYRLMIRLSLCNEWLCRWFKMCWGGSVYTAKHSNYPERHQIWEWSVSNQQAYRFLIVIKPYLILKRDQAELAVKFQGAKRRGCARKEPDVIKQAEKVVYETMKRLHTASYGEKNKSHCL